MQTFLPYANFVLSAKVLDSKRLGKQRLEAKQIIETLEKIESGDIYKNGRKIGWLNHPAVLMWKGHKELLKNYYNAILSEWISRGFKNTMIFMEGIVVEEKPDWFGEERFHSSHRSNLLRKNKEFYIQYGWLEPDNLPYYWPKQIRDKCE